MANALIPTFKVSFTDFIIIIIIIIFILFFLFIHLFFLKQHV